MTLFTRSKFYYGHTITLQNRGFDFREGPDVYSALLRPRGYTLQGFAAEITRSMNVLSDNNYVATVNRETRQITITGDDDFEVLFSGPTAGTSALPLAGFNQDTGEATSHTGEASGFEFIPTLPLQDYTDFRIDKDAVDAVINESASGRVEAVSFGRSSFMSCNIRYQSVKPINGVSNPNAVDELIDFMDYIITKAEIEFMPDKDNPNEFTPCILERSQRSSLGVGYRLTEPIPGFFDTGTLTFRERVL